MGTIERNLHRQLQIISGTAAGRRLLSARGAQTRPMMEKVRWALAAGAGRWVLGLGAGRWLLAAGCWPLAAGRCKLGLHARWQRVLQSPRALW